MGLATGTLTTEQSYVSPRKEDWPSWDEEQCKYDDYAKVKLKIKTQYLSSMRHLPKEEVEKMAEKEADRLSMRQLSEEEADNTRDHQVTIQQDGK